MNDENVDKVPFLLCIPIKKRGNAIEKLAKYQKKHYGTNLDLTLKEVTPAIVEVPVDPPEDGARFLESNSDIKARVK